MKNTLRCAQSALHRRARVRRPVARVNPASLALGPFGLSGIDPRAWPSLMARKPIAPAIRFDDEADLSGPLEDAVEHVGDEALLGLGEPGDGVELLLQAGGGAALGAAPKTVFWAPGEHVVE
jgi:hypothetical protein